MQKLTPYQQSLRDRQISFLPREQQVRIAQARLFAAALPEQKPSLRLTLLSQPHKRSLMRPASKVPHGQDND